MLPDSEFAVAPSERIEFDISFQSVEKPEELACTQHSARHGRVVLDFRVSRSSLL
jgi:hypothetical protein